MNGGVKDGEAVILVERTHALMLDISLYDPAMLLCDLIRFFAQNHDSRVHSLLCPWTTTTSTIYRDMSRY